MSFLRSSSEMAKNTSSIRRRKSSPLASVRNAELSVATPEAMAATWSGLSGAVNSTNSVPNRVTFDSASSAITKIVHALTAARSPSSLPGGRPLQLFNSHGSFDQ